MTKLLQRIDMSIRSFYIFNSKFSQREGEEHKKILFYFPKDIDLNTKIKDVGLSEAIITFTGTFTADTGCKALHTQKTTQVFYQPESDFWMVMVINVPKEIRLKDGIEVADYKGGEVHDKIYRAVLEQCYHIFRLFAGTFEMILAYGNSNAEPQEYLQNKLELFFSKYLLTLRLPCCDIVDTLRCIQYIPLDKLLFLRVHNFINMIQATFPTIKESIFLYNEQVVGSKLNPIDLYSLHEYLISTVFPKATQADLAGGSVSRSTSGILECNRSGTFVTGSEGTETVNSSKAPKVYLARNDHVQRYYLIIYRAMNATICMFVDSDDEPDDDFYVELHSFMGPQLASIASDIGESFTKGTNSCGSSLAKIQLTANGPANDGELIRPKFLFINEQSLMHLGNSFVDRRRPKCSSIPNNVINLIADLHNSINSRDGKLGGQQEEVLIKSTNDYWVVKKTCNWRQLYVIIFNTKATLLDITNENTKIFNQEITNDVFFDK